MHWPPYNIPTAPLAQAANSGGLFTWLIVGVMVLPLIGVGIYLIVDAVRKNALKTHGLRATGRITKVTLKIDPQSESPNYSMDDYSTSSSSQDYYEVRYEFRDKRGQYHTGKMGVSERHTRKFKVGMKGTVYYDPQRPSDNTWVGADS